MISAVHSHYVLDASVAAKWFTRHEESDRDKALSLRDRHRTRRCRLVLPEFGLLEVLNAVRYSQRAVESDVALALDALRDLQLQIEPLDWDLLRKSVAIAYGYQVTLYDASYVALAERIGFPLLTADEAMTRNLRGHSIIIHLRDIEIPP